MTARGAVLWNPGAAPDPTLYVTTWAEVMTAFSTTTGGFTVYLDDSGGGAFSIPAGTYDLDSRFSFSRSAPAIGQITVVMADGVTLQNPAGLYRNITLQANNTTDPAIEMSNGRELELDLGCVLENAGSVPMIDVAAGDSVSLGFYRASSVDPSGDAIADIGVGSTLSATFQGDSQSFDDWVTGDPAGTLALTYDATYRQTTLSAAPGTVSTTPISSLFTAVAESMFFSPVDYLVNRAGGAAGMTNTAGNFTVGCYFTVNKQVTIAGIRFAWGNSAPAARTIRAKLYRNAPGAVLVASVDLAISGPGVYSAYFASPYTCSPPWPTNWGFGVWDTSGAEYCRLVADQPFPGNVVGNIYAYQLSNSVVCNNPHHNYAAGDSGSFNTGFNNHYPSEPIFG